MAAKDKTQAISDNGTPEDEALAIINADAASLRPSQRAVLTMLRDLESLAVEEDAIQKPLPATTSPVSSWPKQKPKCGRQITSRKGTQRFYPAVKCGYTGSRSGFPPIRKSLPF